MIDFPEKSILFMGPLQQWSARERGLIREAQQAALNGFRVIVCCPLDSFLHVEAKKLNLETYPIRLDKKSHWLKAYRQTFRYLYQRYQLTHFHCYDIQTVYSASFFLRKYPHVSLVWSIHGTPPFLKSNWWRSYLMARVDRFLLPSSLSLSRASSSLGVSAHKIARVGLALDQSVSFHMQENPRPIVLGVSLEDQDDCMVTVEVALRALQVTRSRSQSGMRLKFHCATQWEFNRFRRPILDLIETYELTDSVELTDQIDFPTFITNVHICLAPEGGEVPFDQIETCILAQTPVIYPRNRPYRDLLFDIEKGIYSYKPLDARELAEKLLKLEQSWAECRESMLELSRLHKGWHSTERLRRKLAEIYDQTMHRRRKYWARFLAR